MPGRHRSTSKQRNLIISGFVKSSGQPHILPDQAPNTPGKPNCKPSQSHPRGVSQNIPPGRLEKTLTYGFFEIFLAHEESAKCYRSSCSRLKRYTRSTPLQSMPCLHFDDSQHSLCLLKQPFRPAHQLSARVGPLAPAPLAFTAVSGFR